MIIAGRANSTKFEAQSDMKIKLTLLFILALLMSRNINGQTNAGNQDTTILPLPVLVAPDSIAPLSKRDSLSRVYKATDTGTTNLVSKIEEYTQKLNKANTVLKRGFDTIQISNHLPEYEDNLRLIGEFVESKAGISNQRSLSLSRILLTQMENQLKQWQENLLRYSKQLVANNALFNTINTDSALRTFPNDSILRLQYFSQLQTLSKKWVEADSINKVNLYRIAFLQNRVSMNYLKVVDILDIVKVRMLNFSQNIFQAEYEFLLSGNRKGRYDINLYESLRKSIKSNSRVFIYYSRSKVLSPLIFILAGLLFYWWILRALRRIRNSKDGEMKLAQSHFLGKEPLNSAIIVTFTLAPFLYANPPMLYTEMLMLVTLLAISWFAYRNWSKKAVQFWTIAVALFLFYGAINLMVSTTRVERWIFLLVTIFSVWYGIQVRKYLRESNSRVKKVGDIIATLFTILQAVSVIANISGRYGLAKICSVTATFGLTQGFVIFYFIEIVLEAVYLELESHRNQSGIASYFDFQDLDKKLRSLMVIFGTVLWIIITLRNLNVYDFIYTIIEEFFQKSRALGNTTFTLWSIAVFIIVLVIATFLSRIVGYIFGNPSGSIKGISQSKMGSGILLVRLGIYTVGLIVAFVASGIPMDKLTLIIGALGVGIGFGLQNVVNNLVSGVILAFEKPIQIGDVVEVGTRIGVVNEIGIRSSKISTYDGSTVIIPNGDLIAQHIVNWTHGNRSRRIEVLVSVAYGTEVNLCQDLIENIISANKFIMKDPKPMILLEKFGNSSVDFRVLFWTNDIGRWVETKSEIMSAIYQKFDEKGVTIPFPQQDLHIRSIDPEVAKSLQKEK